MKSIIAERVIHDKESRIALSFPYDKELIAIVKGLSDARWSRRMRCWHISDTSDVITLLLKAFRGQVFPAIRCLRIQRMKKEVMEKHV